MKMYKWVVAFAIFILLPVSVFAASPLDDINQKVCDRFETDLARLAAIMDEVRDRKGIKETRVAFGGIDTPVKNADYWVTYVAEALAYQKAQKYSSKEQLHSSLEVLRGKILRAKGEVGKVTE